MARQRHRPFKTEKKEAWPKVIAVCVVIFFAIILLNYFLNKKSQEAVDAIRDEALPALTLLEDRCNGLAETRDFKAVAKGIEDFQVAYRKVIKQEDIAEKIQALKKAMADSRSALFDRDWQEFRKAKSAGNVTLCKTIAGQVQAYGTEAQIQQVTRSLSVLVSARNKLQIALESLDKTIRLALTLVDARNIHQARRELALYEDRFPEFKGEAAVVERMQKTRETLSSKQAAFYAEDSRSFKTALDGGNVGACRALLETVRGYGTPAQIEDMTGRIDKLAAALADAAGKTGTDTAMPDNASNPGDGIPGGSLVDNTSRPAGADQGTSSAAAKKTPAMGFDVSRHEIQEYLDDVKRCWTKSISDREKDGISGTVSLIPSRLEYALAKHALSLLEDGKLDEAGMVKSLKGFVRSNRILKERSHLTISVNTKNQFALFFDKAKGLRDYFDCRIGKSRASYRLVSQNQKPEYRQWEVVTKDLNRVIPVMRTMWFFQGNLTVGLEVNTFWRNGALKVRLKGVPRARMFQRGDGFWEGWNFERGKLQFYKRKPIILDSTEAIFAHDLISRNKTSLPSGLAQFVTQDGDG